jgi:hypothetical protein
MEGKNRRTRRAKQKLRFTKPLKRVRKRYVIGMDDVTFAIRKHIPLPSYLRVLALGLRIPDLAELGKSMKGADNGHNTN